MSSEELGFEPGPMSCGKSTKPTLIDLVAFELDLSDLPFTEAGQTKWKNMMKTYLKNSEDLSGSTVEKFSKKWIQRFFSHLADEVRLQSENNNVFVTGALAEEFFPLLKKHAPDMEWTLDVSCKSRASLASAMKARKLK